MARKAQRAAFGRIFQREGREGFYIRVRVDGQETVRYAGPDRRTAEEVRAETLRKLRRQQLLGEQVIAPVTFAEIEAELMRHFTARHAPSTVESERGRVKRIKEWFGTKPLRDITPADVQDYLTHLRTADKYSVAATNRHASLLSVIFRFAIERGYARSNPVKDLARPREQQRPVPYLSAGDVDRLVSEARDHRLAALLRVLADTGLRRGEALGLAWRDVDLGRKCLIIRQSKNRRTREVPLTQQALRALAQLQQERPAVPISGPDLVWPEWTGMRAQAVSSRFKTVAKRAGLPELRLHDLRHGFCSRLAQAGVPLPTIGALAGHTAWQTTARYASHLPEGATQAAIDRMQQRERVTAREKTRGTSRGTKPRAAS